MRPKSINKYVSDSKNHFAEDVQALSELEMLGLDRPAYELVSDDESMLVPRTAYLLATLTGEDSIRVVNIVLERAGLTNDFYDAEHNSRGALLRLSQSSTSRTMVLSEDVILKVLAFRLVGLSPRLLQEFFKLPDSVLSHPDKYFSSAATEAIARSARNRETYPLRHASDFPNLHKALLNAKAASDLTWENIFRPGHIPPHFSWHLTKLQMQYHSVTAHVNVFIDALSGMSARQIAQRWKFSPGDISRLLNGQSPVFSEVALELIRTKLKK